MFLARIITSFGFMLIMIPFTGEIYATQEATGREYVQVELNNWIGAQGMIMYWEFIFMLIGSYFNYKLYDLKKSAILALQDAGIIEKPKKKGIVDVNET